MCDAVLYCSLTGRPSERFKTSSVGQCFSQCFAHFPECVHVDKVSASSSWLPWRPLNLKMTQPSFTCVLKNFVRSGETVAPSSKCFDVVVVFFK